MTNLQYIWEQISLFFSKGLVIIFAIFGLAGVAARMAFSPKTTYTAGQRILMYFTGGIFSVLIGLPLLHYNIYPSYIALLGYFVGLLSNGFVVYTIDNEKSLFHKLFAIVHGFLDQIINRIGIKKDEENKN